MIRRLCLGLLAALVTLPAAAHKPSDSYLRVLTGPAAAKGQSVSLRWDVALRDLHFLVGLDPDGNSEITWGEVRAKRDAIAGATLSRISVEADGRELGLRLDDLLVTEHSDGVHAVLVVGTDTGAEPERIAVTYRLLFEDDPTHRGLVFLDAGTGPAAPVILSPESNRAELEVDAGAGGGTLDAFGGYVVEGVHHIWVGLDHGLFLLTLLLPAVLLREEGRWAAAHSLRAALGRIAAVVTAFTIAHTITLWLATSGTLSPPSRIVEASIAASIVVCAVHNLAPRLPLHGVAIAFLFGLLHGFGFASVLADLGLAGASLGVALFGFNVGVELGQLAIVALFFPVAWMLRGTPFYRWVVLRGGSVAVAAVALVWMAERLFDLRIISV